MNGAHAAIALGEAILKRKGVCCLLNLVTISESLDDVAITTAMSHSCRECHPECTALCAELMSVDISERQVFRAHMLPFVKQMQCDCDRPDWDDDE